MDARHGCQRDSTRITSGAFASPDLPDDGPWEYPHVVVCRLCGERGDTRAICAKCSVAVSADNWVDRETPDNKYWRYLDERSWLAAYWPEQYKTRFVGQADYV